MSDSIILSCDLNDVYIILGMLYARVKHNKLNIKNIKNIYAESFGVIIAILLLCEISPRDIIKRIYKHKVNNNNNYSLIQTNPLNIISNKFGIIDISIFCKEILEIFLLPIFNKLPTLQEIYDKFDNGISLNINITNVTTSEHVIINKTHELVSENIIDICAMSCTLPIICQAIKLNDNYYCSGKINHYNILDNISMDNNVYYFFVSPKLEIIDDTNIDAFRYTARIINIMNNLDKNEKSINKNLYKYVLEYSDDTDYNINVKKDECEDLVRIGYDYIKKYF